jgi:hypothetical protein
MILGSGFILLSSVVVMSSKILKAFTAKVTSS